jgi:perosamine synthetase
MLLEIYATNPTTRFVKDIKKIQDVFSSSQGLSGNSSIVDTYEQALAQKFNCKYAVAVSSGTAAIHSALMGLNICPGDEVILPVTAAVMTGLPILACGAIPKYVDSRPSSFNICTDSLVKSISSKTKAIISVPMWGYPALSQDVIDIASYYNIPIIEDAAQAIGTINKGKYEGTIGTIGCFSTHEIKLISTGEGGFIVTDNLELTERIRTFSRLGLNKKSSTPSNFGDTFGLNYKLNTLAAILGICEVERLDKTLAKRAKKMEQWDKLTKNILELTNLDYDTEESSYNGYACVKLVTSKYELKSNLLSKLLYDNGIETDIVRYKYKLLPEYKVFKPYYQGDNLKIDFPNATSLLNKLLVLPTHDGIGQLEMAWTTKILKEAVCQLNKEYYDAAI